MLAELIERWTLDAERARTLGCDNAATVLEVCTRELAAALDAYMLEPISLYQAADETGYSYSAIQKGVASGDIPNVGKKGSPKVRRCDLPKKAQPQPVSGLADVILLRRARLGGKHN